MSLAAGGSVVVVDRKTSTLAAATIGYNGPMATGAASDSRLFQHNSALKSITSCVNVATTANTHKLCKHF